MYDIVFLVFLAIALIIGYRNGFLKAAISFVSILVSAFGGFLLYPYVTEILVKTPLHAAVLNWISGIMLPKIRDEALPEMFVKYGADTIAGVVEKMAEGVTIVILNIISILLILILLRLLFHFLKKTAKWINKLPIIGTLNKILGMLVSGASAMILIYIFVAVIVMPPSNQTEFSKEVCRGINGSFILSKAMDYNFFVSYKSLSNVEE